jgi:uncharacterized iron-regulated membrane protein
MKVFLRRTHRWLGLLMALQIIAWMGSGLWFSLFPIEEIRGEHLTTMHENLGYLPPEGADDALGPPSRVQAALAAHFHAPWTVESLGLMRRKGNFYWHVTGKLAGQPFARLVTGDGGAVVARLDRKGARARAQELLLRPGMVESIEWIEEVEPDAEIRGRDLPLWKVSFSLPESLNLYIDPWTGELEARRTARWRVFDFLWMLHILDFETRDDFSHPLLQIAAFLGLVIALSGLALWAATTRLWRRGRG